MTQADIPAFGQGMAVLGEVFGAEVSALRVQGYYEALRDLEWPLVHEAMRQSAQALKWFPKPAELRALVLGDDDLATERAWIAWKQAAQTVGSYRSLIVQDPALAETLHAVFGGWVGACTAELSPEMWASKRKEFERVYRVMVQRGLVGGRYLAGIVEAQQGAAWPSGEVGLIEGATVRLLSSVEADTARLTLGEQAGAQRQIDTTWTT